MGLLSDFLGRQGIYIRQVKDIPGLEDSFFRIAVRTRAENQRLIEALLQGIQEPSNLETKPVPAEIL